MKLPIHRAGYPILYSSGVVLLLLNLLSYRFVSRTVSLLLTALSSVCFGLLLVFFRMPTQRAQPDRRIALAPAQGKVVAIRQVNEPMRDQDASTCVSIYLSLFDIHLNTAPVAGTIISTTHEPGKFLPAFDARASVQNERQSILLETPEGERVLVRLIAGVLARRICNYTQVGQTVQQGDEIGFIRFGSRVDVFFPPTWTVLVNVGQRVKVGVTPLAQRS